MKKDVYASSRRGRRPEAEKGGEAFVRVGGVRTLRSVASSRIVRRYERFVVFWEGGGARIG